MAHTLYCIRAHLLCHDVRLNTSIEAQGLFDHLPTEEEVLPLLWPVAEARVTRDFCEGCNYSLSVTGIQPVDPPPAEQ